MKKAFLIMMAMVLMSGCALISRIAEMSPKHKALWMMSTFNAEWIEFQQQGAYYFHPETTDADRLMMRWKLALLQKVYPLIEEYAERAEHGLEADLNLENLIVDIINQILQAEITGAPEGAELAPGPEEHADERA